MRAYLRLLPLVASAAALHPVAAAAQRSSTIPPLYVQPVARPDTTTPDTAGLRFRIGQAPARGRERQPVAPSTQLAAADAARILARLPALTAPAAADSFAFPARTLPAPRTGRVLLAAFPPPDTAAPPRPSGPREPAALTLVRAAPRGQVDVAAEVTVTFSQPMVPLSSVGAVQGRPVPVRLSPQPEGSWRWIDVRTLVFTPRGRMPASTQYTVTVPAGTRAETGGRMAEGASWTFTTQRLSAIGGQPYGNGVGLEPLIVIRFDQRIDPAAVLPYVRVLAGDPGVRIPLRLATAQEIQADPQARLLAEHGDSVHWLAVRPVRPLPRAARVQVRVDPGAPSLEGPLPTRIAQSWTFRTYGPLRVERVGCGGREVCRPGEPIHVELTTPASASAEEMVQVEPEIPGMDVTVYDTEIVISGATRPLTRYTIRLSGELRDVFGQSLGRPQTHTVQVGTSVPGIMGFHDRLIVLDPSGPRRVSVTSHDHARLRIRIHRVEPADWPRFVAGHGRGPRPGHASGPHPGLPGREVVNRVVDVEGGPGEATETVIDLDEVLGGRPGHVIVGVEAVEGVERVARHQATYAWVQSTRIGLAAFADPEAVTAWTTSLVDGAPLPGVRISVGGRPASSATDAGGVAEVPSPGRPVSDETAYVVAEGDGDRALLPLGRTWGEERRATVLWYGLTDRNLYRPGEEVRFKGWARRFERSKTGGLRLPHAGDAQVAWRVLDPRRNEVARGTSPLTALGGFDGAFRVPEGSNLGDGSVELHLQVDGREEQGSIPFQVQEFRRPEFEVGLDAPAGPHVVGGNAELAVRASYFAGGGLAGAPVSWTVTSTRASFTPPGWGAWRFGMEPDYPWRHHGRGPEPNVVRTFQGRTDADGRHAVRLDFERADPPAAHTLQVQSTVVDVNRQPWTSNAQLLVHPAEVYAGVRTERAWVEAGTQIELGIVAVDLDGKVVPGRPVAVLAERMEWRQLGGTWSEVPVDSARCTVVSEANPVSCSIRTDARGGTYRITADVTDARGRPSRTQVRVWAWGATPWMQGPGEDRNAQRQVRLVPDREEYAPGDTARILVQLPFWPARGLLTVRREGIVRTDTLASDGPTLAVSVPIGEADIPNLHVQVDVVGAHDRQGQRQPTARGTDFAAGTATLRVPPGPRTLRVTATPADSVQLPESPGAVDVEVRDAAGRPLADAEVAVVIVDEAVLALTGFVLQHPVQLFYPDWLPGTADAHLRPLVRLFSDSLGEPGVVWGVVIEAQTRQPAAGAVVEVEGQRTVTDAAGQFRIANVPAGRRTVRVSRVGMSPAVRSVVVGSEPLTALHIELTAQAINLESLVVTGVAGPTRRRRQAEDEASVSYVMVDPAPPVAAALQGKVAGAQPADPAIAVRANFAALALWAPVVRTDGAGRARVPFTLPSSLTRYRVMAVAVSGGTLYGMDEASVTARQPLMVRPSAPRFLNFGDRFDLPVVIQNQTDAPVEVQVAARGEGLAFADAGRRVTVPARDRVEVRIPGEAVRPGTAQVQIAAVAGTMTDAAQVSLPVYTPATAEAFATYGSIAEGGVVELPLQVPSDAIPAFGGLEVTTSSTALQELTDAFLYLVRYPYECAEQISSRILAVAALRDVLAEFRAEGMPSPQALADSVARDIQALRGMQQHDGGFAFWSGNRESWPYVSIHVAHALLRIRERGYAVPDEMLRPALEYVSVVERHIPRWYPRSARLALRAYAAYVLERADHPRADERLAAVLRQARMEEMPLEVAGWLLTATADRPRFATERAELLRIINNRATETASTATFATRYEEGEYLLLHSDRRTDAIVLEALLAADPRSELATKTVRGLLGHRTAGRWENTQENGWVLLALDRYFRVYEGQTPEFVARVWLGERFAGEQRFVGRSADRIHLDVPMRVLAGDDPRSLTIGKEGPGRLYYRAGLRYAPRDLDLAPLERGFAVERSYEAVDDPADVVRGQDGRWRVKAGARVRITVTVTAPSRRVHVAMVDPLPAGFEAVNTDLRGAEQVPPSAEDQRRAPWERAGGWWWWGPWYEHQNVRDDRVEAFASLLPAGVFTYTYVARATTPGLFIVPPPRAEEMYSPETFGRGASERVLVEAEDGGE